MSTSDGSMNRRRFLDIAATAAGMAAGSGRAGAQSGPRGANDKVRIGLIGSGNRGRSVAALFVRNHADAQYVAVCDAYRMRVDQGVEELSQLQKDVKVEPYEDYRRILERKDIDAVHIATPDHWHTQMLIDAMAAGKDVYLEKPLSNTVERAVEALRAYQASNRVVQFGTQQRSGSHFQEAAKIVQEGQLGKITHAVIQFGGSGYGTPPEPVVPVPDGLNWELFQGPASKRPFKQGRLRWRGWWDYGGGLITDWGVHLTDVALWYLNAQHVGPLLTSGTAQYVNFVNPERDQSPDAFSVSWQYPDFVMTFTNVVVQDWEFGRQGNYFFGPGGSLLIHRAGYELRPGGGGGGGRGRGSQGPGNSPQTAAAASAQTPPSMPPPVQPRRVPWRESDGSDSNSATIAHGRDFLNCVKSRKKPLSDLEVGFYASLPCLIAVKAVREGQCFRWDDAAKKVVAV
jgi:predicted dehydrogenase